jgi:hypothetical protein
MPPVLAQVRFDFQGIILKEGREVFDQKKGGKGLPIPP